MEPRKTDGQLAYEAYGEARNWVTWGGTPMPTWENQSPDLQDAWTAAANAVRFRVQSELL